MLGVFLRQNPQFSQAIVVDESGGALSIRLGQKGLVAEEVADFRARPWYVGALGRAAAGDSSVFWTEPYEFRVSAENKFGMSRPCEPTAPVAMKGRDGRRRRRGYDGER